MLRAACLILNTMASHAVLTSPNATPEGCERAKFAKELRAPGIALILLGTIAKVVVHSLTIVEMSAIIFSSTRVDTLSWLPLLPKLSTALKTNLSLRVTPVFLVASGLMWGAAMIRVACYRYLGRQFTFELALRKGHKLVTGGPYAFVRHPAYTGSLMYVTGGMLALLMDQGSMWVQLGLWETRLGRLLATSFLTLAALAVFLFVRRTQVEDEVLCKEFGKEWVRWSERTPYRLVPYVF